MIATFEAGRVTVHVGDITVQQVDAVVNAANSTLLGGGGVDGAIHRAGGPAILAACQTLRAERFPHGLPTGEAVATTGGQLHARHVIHTVGPIFGRHAGLEPQLLAACYRRALSVAVELAVRSIAFPAISTGVYGYPADQAAQVAAGSVREFLQEDRSVEEVRFVFFSDPAARVFLAHSGW